MKQNLIQKTLIALCLTALASFSACTQTTPAQPTYATHLYTKSNANGTVEVVKGAPTGADANLEMTNAKKVTHTFSDGSFVTWNAEENAVFFDGLDYGVTSPNKMFNVILDGEVRLKKNSLKAVLQSGNCAGFSIGVLCITTQNLEKAPNQIFYFTFNGTHYNGRFASEDTKSVVRSAAKIWNDRFAASSIHTKLKWVEVPSYDPNSGTVEFYEVSTLSGICGGSNSIGYIGANSYIQINSTNYWGDSIVSFCPGSKLNVVLHEMGHKMGLFHEHSRCDRSTKGPFEFYFYTSDSNLKTYSGDPLTETQEKDFIESNCDAVRGGFSDDVHTTPLGSRIDITPYDINSIMHYSASLNLLAQNRDKIPSGVKGISFRFKYPQGQATQSSSQVTQLKTIGLTEIPSTYDVFAIADLYRCKSIPTDPNTCK